MTKLSAWIQATRPKTLTAALIPIFVGSALAYCIRHEFKLELAVLAFLCAVLIQIGTNFINDALDFRKGADKNDRLGPKRGIQNGIISQGTVWWAGLICFALAVLLSLPLVWAGGWPILLIGIVSLIAGYAYTGGPYPLAYVGLGDLFVLVFFGWVSIGGVYYLHTGVFDFAAFVAGSQIGLLATVLIAVNNLRDHKSDLLAHKMTLAVRLGVEYSRIEIVTLAVLPFLLGIYWHSIGLKLPFWLPCLMAPLAGKIIHSVYENEPGVIYNRFLAQSALLHLGFGFLFGLGLILR